MASHLSVSLSDSVQASLIIRHREQRNQQHSQTGRQNKPNDNYGDEVGDSTKSLSLRVQCLLVMVFAGVETSVTFTLIYAVLFLQYVGVPSSLLSMPGVFCGSTTIILLPIIGWFSDRGSNPLKSKIKLMLIAFAAYVMGYSCLAVCCVTKLYSFEDVKHQDANNPGIALLYNFTTGSYETSFHYNTSHLENITMASNTSDSNNDATPGVISYISIIAFGLLDAGFDASMSLCRAFVLECSPPVLHTKLLVMATVFASISGATFSIIGTIDFPGILGPMFNVDGTAATVLMFSAFILTFVICCFACTVITGYLVAKENMKVKDQRHFPDSQGVEYEIQTSNRRLFKTPWWKTLRPKTTKDASTLTDPLLASSRLDARSYSAFSVGSDGECAAGEHKAYTFGVYKPQHQRVLSTLEQNENVIYENEPYEIKAKQRVNEGTDDVDDDENNDDVEEDEGSVDNDYYDEGEMSYEDQRENGPFFPIMAAIRASYSMSASLVHSTFLGDFQNRKTNEDTQTVISQNEGDSYKGQNIFKNKRLIILCVSIFYTIGALILFSEYHSTTLTTGIYHGEPSAAPGTKGRALYEKGLRNAALGNLIMYLAYTTLSLMNKKIIDFIGEKINFIAVNIIFTAVLITFVFIQTEELYYVTSAISGLHRACAFTLGYILANKIVQEHENKEDSKKPVKNVGQVMVLIGFLLPCQYLLTSIMVGPLLSATGSVWVTMIMAAVYGALSVLVFSLLFIFKR